MKIDIYPPLSIYELGQRANQEDAIAQWNNRLFVLCDGMGGHEKGEVASQTVCQSLVNWFQEHIHPDDVFSDSLLREALEYAYTELDKFDDGSPKKMGTTLTLLYIHTQGVTAAHIGDSRIYHIRASSTIGGKASGRQAMPGNDQKGTVIYQSRDHSLVFDLYQAGEITYEEMATYPQKNIITRAMTPGEANRIRPDIIHITDVQPGDYFYLCSDGMLEHMDGHELSALLSSNTSDEGKRALLTEATLPNRDNHSAWLIHVRDVIREEGDEQLVNEEPTARCNALNIMPKASVSNDVQLAEEDDDVVVVSAPQPPRKKLPIQKLAIAFVAILVGVMAVWLLFPRHTGEEEMKEQPNEEPAMQKPITSRLDELFKNDTTIKDTTQAKHGTRENQQPVDAPRRNDSTRNIQDR